MRNGLGVARGRGRRRAEKQPQKWLKIGLFYTGSSHNQEYLNSYTRHTPTTQPIKLKNTQMSVKGWKAGEEAQLESNSRFRLCRS